LKTASAGAFKSRKVQGLLSITLEFWRETHQPPDQRGEVFVAEVPEAELINVLEQLIATLGCGDRA
jgi:hypothetical protein